MKNILLNIHKELLLLPSNQFWVIIFGFFFLALVLAGALGAIGLLIGAVISTYAGGTAALRIFDNRKCDQDD